MAPASRQSACTASTPAILTNFKASPGNIVKLKPVGSPAQVGVYCDLRVTTSCRQHSRRGPAGLLYDSNARRSAAGADRRHLLTQQLGSCNHQSLPAPFSVRATIVSGLHIR